MLIKIILLFSLITRCKAEDYNDVKETYELCSWSNGEYSCVISKVWDKFVYEKDNVFYNTLPIDVCYDNSCEECITSWKTLAIDNDYKLYTIGAITHNANNNDGIYVYYDCYDNSERCECQKNNCNGDPEFCLHFSCAHDATCTCETNLHGDDIVVFDSFGKQINDAQIVNFETCLVRKNLFSYKRRVKRQEIDHIEHPDEYTNEDLAREERLSYHTYQGKTIIAPPGMEPGTFSNITRQYYHNRLE